MYDLALDLDVGAKGTNSAKTICLVVEVISISTTSYRQTTLAKHKKQSFSYVAAVMPARTASALARQYVMTLQLIFIFYAERLHVVVI